MTTSMEPYGYLQTLLKWSVYDQEAWVVASHDLTEIARNFEKETHDQANETAYRSREIALLSNYVQRLPVKMTESFFKDISLHCRMLIAPTLEHLLSWAISSEIFARCSVSRMLCIIEPLVLPIWIYGEKLEPIVGKRLWADFEKYLQQQGVIDEYKNVINAESDSGKLVTNPRRDKHKFINVLEISSGKQTQDQCPRTLAHHRVPARVYFQVAPAALWDRLPKCQKTVRRTTSLAIITTIWSTTR